MLSTAKWGFDLCLQAADPWFRLSPISVDQPPAPHICTICLHDVQVGTSLSASCACIESSTLTSAGNSPSRRPGTEASISVMVDRKGTITTIVLDSEPDLHLQDIGQQLQTLGEPWPYSRVIFIKFAASANIKPFPSSSPCLQGPIQSCCSGRVGITEWRSNRGHECQSTDVEGRKDLSQRNTANNSIVSTDWRLVYFSYNPDYHCYRCRCQRIIYARKLYGSSVVFHLFEFHRASLKLTCSWFVEWYLWEHKIQSSRDDEQDASHGWEVRDWMENMVDIFHRSRNAILVCLAILGLEGSPKLWLAHFLLILDQYNTRGENDGLCRITHPRDFSLEDADAAQQFLINHIRSSNPSIAPIAIEHRWRKTYIYIYIYIQLSRHQRKGDKKAILRPPSEL